MTSIIGYGTYGCVTKPSLKCNNSISTSKTKKNLYKNKVSKLMKHEDAINELREMETVATVKNIKKYIVKVPYICKPEQNNDYYTIAKKCGNVNKRIKNTYRDEPDKLRLLLLEDGGINLTDVLSLINTFSETDVKCFLTSILKLIQGVKFFLKNNIIHRDIKLDNIVYNISTGEIKFIDFGLVTYYDTFIQESMESKNTFAQSWLYYPKEFSCINKDDYEAISKCQKYQQYSYDLFLKKSADTFDSYCLSYALKYLFHNLYKHHNIFSHIQQTFLGECIILMDQYCHIDVYKRESNLSKFYTQYKKLLKSYHLFCSKKPNPSLKNITKAEELSINTYTNSSKDYKTPDINNMKTNTYTYNSISKRKRSTTNKSKSINTSRKRKKISTIKIY